MFSSFCFQRILRIQNPVYMYIYVFFFLFPENTENTEPSIHVHLCFLLSVSREYWEYRTQYTCTSMFSSFCFQRILRIQNPVYMYIYVFFFLFPENTENTEPSIHVHLCFLLSVSREYWEYRTQYTCTSMFSSFCFQNILKIQNPVYMYIYVFFFLFPENTENTEPSIHVHLCFLLSVSREYWEYRTQYTCTSMFSSFCFQNILKIQNPVYMYIYVFFSLFPEHSENTEPSIHVHLCFLLSVSRNTENTEPSIHVHLCFLLSVSRNTENTEPSIHVHLCFLLSDSRTFWEYRTQYTCTSMFSSFCFQRILRIQNPVYMYIYVFFFLFPENTENTEPSIHVHLCFLLSVSREYWEYRTQYTCTSMFSSFCFQRILRIQNPVYMYIYVFFFLFPSFWENTENTEPSIHVHLCFLLSVSRTFWKYRTQYTCTSMFSSFCFQRILRIQNPVYMYIYVFFFLFPENTWEYRTQYTCTSMFSSLCFQRILRIQNPVYMYIYVFFFLFPENTENTEPSIHVHLCFLLSVSREYWEYRTQYTCTSMFSSFCFQNILKIQNPVYMYIYVFFFLNTENTEPSIHVHLCFLLSVSREYWEYRTQYTCTSMFSSFCFQRILRIQNPVYMYIYVFFFLFPEIIENTEPSIHVHLCFLLSVSRTFWKYRTQYTCTSMFSSFCFQRILRIQNPVYMYIYVFFFLFPEHSENTEPSIHVHLCFLLSEKYWEYRTQYTCTSMFSSFCFQKYWEYRTQYTCTSMFSSFCFQRILRIQNPVYMYIYVFFFLFPENTENTEPSIHVHLCFLLSVSFFLFPENTENTEPSIHVHLCFLLSVSRTFWKYRTQYTCTFFFLFPENTENTEPSIHVHLCFLLSVSRKYWEYRTQYTCTSMFSSFCFQRILRIQNPVYMYIYVFFFLFPENTENTEPSIHVHLCFLLSVSREYWEYRTQYTCTSMFSSLCFQRILRIQNPVYMYIYVFFFLFPENTENTEPSIHVHLCFLLSVSFFLFPENTENTEPSIHVHLCFLLSVSRTFWKYRTQYTCTSMFSSFCFQRILRIQNPVYMYIYVFFFLFPEIIWEYRTQYTCTSMFSSFCFQRILRIQNPVYMYIYVFFFLFPENTENTEPSIHVHLCFLLSVSREYWEYRTQYTCTSMFSSFCFQK